MTDNPDAFDEAQPEEPRQFIDEAVIAAVVFEQTTKRWRNRASGRFVSNQAVTNEMRRHVAATFDTLDNLTNALYDGNITVMQWQTAVASELKDAHLAQAMFAKGGRANMRPADFGRVGGVLRDEFRFLDGFAQDIADGRQSRAQALARIKQYGKATQQSYWREWALDTEGEIYWRLHPAEHCQDCIDLANNSPYTADTLPTYPGAGETQCRGNCNCTLERR